MTSPPDRPTTRTLRDRIQRLHGIHEALTAERARVCCALEDVRAHLEVSRDVSTALDRFGREMFGDLVHVLEEKLSIALEEVLEQPIRLRVTSRYLRGAAALEFHIERPGSRSEHILKGQGGSVANVLSVGLRLFALTSLDPAQHRRFLVLDEQDCWLRPDLVPRLVRIIRDATDALGFQTLVISHHDWKLFRPFAHKIIRLEPSPTGVRTSEWVSDAK